MASALDAVIAVDAQGLVVAWNAVAVRIFGWLAEEALGRALDELIIPSIHRAAHRDGMRRYQRTGEARVVNRRIEIGAIDKGAREFPVELSIVATPDSDGVAFIGFLRDISDRRAAETALRDVNANLEQRVEERTAERNRIWTMSRDLFAIMGFDGHLKAINPAWETTLGFDEATLLSRPFPEQVHPDDHEAVRAMVARLEQGEPIDHFEDRLRHADGTWRRISWSLVPEGDIFYAVGRDVTAEWEAQSALLAAEAARRETDALYRAYFRHSGEALFIVGVLPDGGFTIEELNPAHEAATGLRTSEVRGKRIEEVVPPDVARAVIARYRQAVAGGEVQSYRETFDLGSGLRHWDTVLVPVRSPDGNVVRLVGSGRDVTARVSAEDALRQAQKMEAMGKLTGGIAHDFNNLLGAVVGSLDLIRLKPTDIDRVRRYAEAGLHAAERGAKLTAQLLAFSRAQRIEQKPLVLSQLVEDMRDMLDRAIGPLVRLTLDLGGPGVVLSDPTQLEMAILNLAINARDAMPDGGELRISTASRLIAGDPELTSGDYEEVAVTDTGIGMPPEVAARAFDPFFTTKPVGEGTGLGLSQVYGIARQTGGTVRIESRPGHGTSIRILLPRSSEQVCAAAGLQAADPAAAPQKASILVVDDDPDLRRILVDTLEAIGYEVCEASDGESGLAELERSAPDLMMVDFAMPGMDGAELAKAARERRPGLPIVFASGYSDTAAIEKVMGPDAVVLRKPFRVDDLHSAVAEVLDRQARPR